MQDNKYRTTDLSTATYLVYDGFVLEGIEGNGARKDFVFGRKQNKKIENVVQKYQTRQTKVEPRRYFEELRAIKNRMYSN